MNHITGHQSARGLATRGRNKTAYLGVSNSALKTAVLTSPLSGFMARPKTLTPEMKQTPSWGNCAAGGGHPTPPPGAKVLPTTPPSI
jgi:hypothetical protein